MTAIHTLLAAGAIAGLIATPALADGVNIEHAAARVVVIAEPRGDYAISINQGRAGLKPLEIRKDGGVTVVDGGYGGHYGFFWGGFGLNCRGPQGHERVSIPGRGDVAVADLPVITIHAPLDAHIGAGQAVFGEVNGARSLDLGNSGCGDWRVGDVHGPLHLGLSGSGDVRGGNAPDVGVSIAGSGDLRFHGTAGSVHANIAGSGDVDIARATGPISKHVFGSGDINIGR